MGRVAVVMLALMCLGQSCVPAPAPSTNRLEVTDKLRRACAGFADGGAQIEVLIAEADSNLGRGVRKADYVSGLLRVCGQTGDTQGTLICQTCAVAVSNQVYGD